MTYENTFGCLSTICIGQRREQKCVGILFDIGLHTNHSVYDREVLRRAGSVNLKLAGDFPLINDFLCIKNIPNFEDSCHEQYHVSVKVACLKTDE